MRNVHERTIDAPAEQVGVLLHRLGDDDDPVWPSPAWVPIRFDRPLQVGADGGHHDVKYWVSEHEPGRRVRFEFHPETGIDGFHELSVEPAGDDRCIVRHVLQGRPRGAMRLLVPLAVRSLHDATVEDLLDRVERSATGEVAQPARWSPWVRLWRRLTEFPKPRTVQPPANAMLIREALDRVDLSDAWQVSLEPGMPTDPQVWADAVFRDPPRLAAGLMALRNRVVPFVGIARADRSVFDTLDRTDREVLLGTDDGHLDFRASVHVDDDRKTVTLTTVVKVHNRRGRLYMAIVWRLHPRIVKRMLHRALHRLAERAFRHPDLRPDGGRGLAKS